MNILVLGAGTVGTSIAELLCNNRHSVTVIDSDPELTRRIDEELDVRGVVGSATEANVLFQAGAMSADLCLAVTGIDSTNLVSASVAKAMGTHRTIARVYSPPFLDRSTFDYQRHFNIDRLLSLEHLSALELARNIPVNNSIPIESFARGEIELQAIDISEDAVAVGKHVHELGLPKTVRIGSLSRDGKHRIAQASNQLEAGDRITLLGTHDDIDEVRELFHTRHLTKTGVVIAGGGETGYHLARVIEGKRFGVVLMENDRKRCEFLAARLKHTTVVHSDATTRAHLEEERIGSADVFVACTGDDENNILAGVEARELGAKSILAIVSRPDYANVVHKLGIDYPVSPRAVMAKQILGFLTTGPVVSHTTLGNGAISVLEIEVSPQAPAVEHVLARLELPPGCLLAAVMREEHARVPGANDRLKAGDTVVALVESAAVSETLHVFEAN